MNYAEQAAATLRAIGIPAQVNGSRRWISVTLNGDKQCWHMLSVVDNLTALGYTDEQIANAQANAAHA